MHPVVPDSGHDERRDGHRRRARTRRRSPCGRRVPGPVGSVPSRRRGRPQARHRARHLADVGPSVRTRTQRSPGGLAPPLQRVRPRPPRAHAPAAGGRSAPGRGSQSRPGRRRSRSRPRRLPAPGLSPSRRRDAAGRRRQRGRAARRCTRGPRPGTGRDDTGRPGCLRRRARRSRPARCAVDLGPPARPRAGRGGAALGVHRAGRRGRAPAQRVGHRRAAIGGATGSAAPPTSVRSCWPARQTTCTRCRCSPSPQRSRSVGSARGCSARGCPRTRSRPPPGARARRSSCSARGPQARPARWWCRICRPCARCRTWCSPVPGGVRRRARRPSTCRTSVRPSPPSTDVLAPDRGYCPCGR